jgi:hypothetical protein
LAREVSAEECLESCDRSCSEEECEGKKDLVERRSSCCCRCPSQPQSTCDPTCDKQPFVCYGNAAVDSAYHCPADQLCVRRDDTAPLLVLTNQAESGNCVTLDRTAWPSDACFYGGFNVDNKACRPLVWGSELCESGTCYDPNINCALSKQASIVQPGQCGPATPPEGQCWTESTPESQFCYPEAGGCEFGCPGGTPWEPAQCQSQCQQYAFCTKNSECHNLKDEEGE